MATAKKAPAKAEGTKAPAAKRAPNAAFLKPLTPSPLLAAVIGAAPLPRTEVTKKVWEYIKAHNLQDAATSATSMPMPSSSPSSARTRSRCSS